MIRNLILSITLLLFVGCSNSDRISFVYNQDFSPDSKSITDQSTRLQFDDVREETRLSNWRTANWELSSDGVQVIGSRRLEYERRKQVIRDIYQGQESFVMIREFRVPWLTLSMGELEWCDYTVTTSIRFNDNCTAGVAFRYLNPRQYYAFMLNEDQGTISLVLRKMDKEATPEKEAWDVLKSMNYKLLRNKVYKVSISVDESKIECNINDNDVILEYEDTNLPNGKIALLADNPVFFGPVTVTGEKKKTEPLIAPAFARQKLVFELPLPGKEIERDFIFLDVDSDKENEIIIAEKNNGKYCYRCLEFDGTELWVIENLKYPTTEGGDFTIQVFDINGDGLNEIVTAIDFQIQVRNGKTGKLLYSVATPQQNPYFDSRDYEYERLLGDALCPVKHAKDEPSGFYIKDRYTNLWLYDNNLNLLWHKALSTAHFPLPVDVDGDGLDEIMANHTLLKSDGTIVWSLPLSDHVDNIMFTSLNPGKDPDYFYFAAGEMGLLKVHPSTGEIIKRYQLGHVQTISVADYLPEKEGLELILQTSWREDNIHCLFDKELNLLNTWQGEYGRMFPLPWGKDGRDLLITPDGIVDPITGSVLEKISGRVIGVLEDKPWGNVLIATEENDYLKLYAPIDLKIPEKRILYSHIQSHYLPVVELSSAEQK